MSTYPTPFTDEYPEPHMDSPIADFPPPPRVPTLMLQPMGLSRDCAARYISVGVTKFDQMVADGRMPLPRKADGRLIWIRSEVDAALMALPVARS